MDRLAKKHDIPVISDEIQAGMGNYFLGRLRSLQGKYPFIHDLRGIGLMDAVEMDSRERIDRMVRKAFGKGLLLLGCGYKVIRFLPPLDVRKRETDLFDRTAAVCYFNSGSFLGFC